MTRKDTLKKKSVDELLTQFLPEWIDTALIFKPKCFVHVFEGRIKNKKNLYSSFRYFLIEKEIFDPIPPQKFCSYLEQNLLQKKVAFYKRRLSTGLVLNGVNFNENEP